MNHTPTSLLPRRFEPLFFFLVEWMKMLTSSSFFLSQTAAKAIEFYDDKVKGLDSNLLDLEKIVQAKSTQLRAVEEG